MVASVPWGMLIDRIGPNKVITLSATASGIALLGVLVANNVVQLCAVYLIEGLLAAGLFPSSVKIVSSLNGPMTPYLAVLESAAPVVLLVISTSGLVLSNWREFYVLLTLGLLATAISS
ncbi:hypothetical protein IC006_0581 [Sulfuracidifex tepidarius]|uniref:Major facilitator superfamily (MFS) profile domain-containing protein n=1 Tax=Sulfuracidifex tepidarius TaxID=1294262 RepID=A0A510DT28_9CREN|nr:hypothetical protein IC006_0581 [Sulfuracidifex tepidarius]